MSWPQRIACDGFALRPWREEDADDLVFHANDPQVARSLGERFPHPYALDDARLFIAHALHLPNEKTYAIEINGVSSGGIGAHPGEGVERHSAELGYWVGRSYWGEGIATAAIRNKRRRARTAMKSCACTASTPVSRRSRIDRRTCARSG
jgi:RimJ/RimL family protein N-acetyltransferase